MTQSLVVTLNKIASLCIENAWKIVTAESCTGGGIAYAITALPGSSAWFDRGFITYSNRSKVEMLAVEQADLEKYGAVSQAVAQQMAIGALKNSGASLSVSVTGIAGPEGAVPGKPVGLVWFSWSSLQFGTHCQKVIFSGNRSEIREQAILFSLQHLVSLL